jgi:hypothetical protein
MNFEATRYFLQSYKTGQTFPDNGWIFRSSKRIGAYIDKGYVRKQAIRI